MACPDSHSHLATEANEILTLVRALRRDLLRNPVTDADRSGLTGPQVIVMACLANDGPMTLTELSGQLGMGHSTASGIVDRLAARGFVRRTKDAADRRRTQIAVTEIVNDYVQELAEGPTGRLAVALANATDEQRRAIKDGLLLLRELLHNTETPKRG